MSIEVTQAMIERIHKMFKEISACNGVTEFFDGTYFFFTSEIGTLRLFKKFAKCGDKAHSGFSKNLNKWFFRLETKGFHGNRTTDI
jgi:hypothetical protein